MASQQLYSYLGRAALWRNVRDKLAAMGTRLAPSDSKALNDLCAGVTWMQRIPPALLASYRALYVILRGDAAEAEEEINRDILRTVRGVTGLLLDFSQDQRGEFAASINRVLNALAHVDDMGYCQGQNYVVDVMMKAGLPERETFCLFLYLLRQGHLHGIYRKEVPMLAGYMDKFEEQLRLRLPELAAHFEAEHYPPPLYALEWMTTLFGLAAQPLVSLVALDLFLAGARNPVLRLCVSLVGSMERDLMEMDQEGLLEDFRSRAVQVDAEEAIVRALSDGGGGRVQALETKRSRAGADRPLGWATGPDYLLVLRSRHCQTVGLVELREEARSGLLKEHSALQDALLAVTRSLGWGCLRTCWLQSCLAARSDHERHLLASQSLRFVITNGGHPKAAAFMLGVGGADANAVDSRLLSPLHLVALFNRPDVARVLLMCGASPGLAGGVTRAAAARGGKLWSPLEMAEEACTEGGELDEAGVAVGPAALYVLRGQVCLQCNTKLSRPAPCRSCKLTFCKTCVCNHFCVGKLDLPRGVPMAAGAATKPKAFAESEGNGRSRRRPESGRRSTLWELGSAIGDGWELLFSETNANARGGGSGSVEGEEDWKPGGLRRAESGASKSTEDDLDVRVPPAPWVTMPSVLLGTWERRPLINSPKDRNKMFDNSAAFVRACFPAQTWLQYHMEEEMGLSLGVSCSRNAWGGPFKGLGMSQEYFNPEIMRVATSTGLHRRMSWVMAESGVPWEESDETWCCPECYILFSLNVFRHHCRGCGQIYCSAHAPATPVPPSDRPLKLCWSCVLEGAVPLPSSPLSEEDARTSISLYPSTACGIADQFSPTASTLPVSEGGAYVPPQPPSPTHIHENDDERESKKGGGFLSTLVSIIEVVAASPVRSRDASRAANGARSTRAARPKQAMKPEGSKRPLSAPADGGGNDGDEDGDVTKPVLSPRAGTAGSRKTSGRPPRSPIRTPPRSPADRGDLAGVNWRAGWSTPSPARTASSWRGGWAPAPSPSPPYAAAASVVSAPKARLEGPLGSSVSTASSTEPGDEYDTQLRLRRGEDASNIARTGLEEREDVPREHPVEKPVELGFPSERPWALGFGSG